MIVCRCQHSILRHSYACIETLPAGGLVDKAPSHRIGENGFETGKVHAVWSVLLDSASWHLAIEGLAGLQ